MRGSTEAFANHFRKDNVMKHCLLTLSTFFIFSSGFAQTEADYYSITTIPSRWMTSACLMVSCTTTTAT